MKTLGIETSCDETSIAVLEDGHKILSLETFSQIDLHKRYGGVVPELASRRHSQLLTPLLARALHNAHCTLQEIDLICATYGPGLVGALMTGLSFAKTLALDLQKPFVGVNHLQAHLFAALLSNAERSFTSDKEIVSSLFPALGLIVSGGHCDLVQIDRWGDFTALSRSIDDAPGEAFDKAAQLLGWSYPGGPIIEQQARLYREKQKSPPAKNPFTIAKVKADLNLFSFSGLKTQVYYAVEKLKKQQLNSETLLNRKQEIAYFFQECVCSTIEEKIKRLLAKKGNHYRSLLVGGGVSANQNLKKTLVSSFDQKEFPVLWPTKQLSLDQAAMIAGTGYYQYLQKGPSSLSLGAQGRIPFLKK